MPPGLVSPDSFPARDPRDRKMVNGRVLNPPRFMEIGGASTQAIWTREGGNKNFSQMEQKNVARVEKPSAVKSAHASGRESE